MLEYSVFNCVSFIYICYKVQSTKCKSKTLRTAKEGCSSVAGYPWMALLRSSWLSFKSLTLIRSHHLATINLATTPSHPPRRTVMRKRISAGPRPSPPPVLIVLSSSTIRRESYLPCGDKGDDIDGKMVEKPMGNILKETWLRVEISSGSKIRILKTVAIKKSKNRWYLPPRGLKNEISACTSAAVSSALLLTYL